MLTDLEWLSSSVREIAASLVGPLNYPQESLLLLVPEKRFL